MRCLPFSLLLFIAGPAPATGAPLSELAARGKAVMAAAQCNRCHAVTDLSGAAGLAPADRAMHCVDCHRWILGTKGDDKAIARQRLEFPDWDRYLENIEHFVRLPDLGTLTRRVDPRFVRRFLDAPVDLRPHLDESMIPLRLSAADKDAVVAYLVALGGEAVAGPAGDATAGPAPGSVAIEAGRALFVRRGCPTCHLVGNARLGGGFDLAFYRAMRAAIPVGDVAAPVISAPNLRFVRARMARAGLVRFIEDPAAVDPRTVMPKPSLEPGDAERIADFLLFAPIDFAGRTAPDPAPEVPMLQREVTYDEVFDEVLGRICVHCHMNPTSNNGDGGAGNTGGLGFAGLGLDLETYAGLKRGMVRDGKPQSVLAPARPGEAPLLLEVLLRRQREASRDRRLPFADAPAAGVGPDPAHPGMPMGLPPLDPARLALVKTWVAQGAPGPLSER